MDDPELEAIECCPHGEPVNEPCAKCGVPPDPRSPVGHALVKLPHGGAFLPGSGPKPETRSQAFRDSMHRALVEGKADELVRRTIAGEPIEVAGVTREGLIFGPPAVQQRLNAVELAAKITGDLQPKDGAEVNINIVLDV